jgi:hypothetical protein
MFGQAYASFLSLLSIAVPFASTRYIVWNLNTVLLATLATYLYRDILPLATFDEQPLDIEEGRLLWARIVILAGTAIFIPLLMPRQYIPVDDQVRFFSASFPIRHTEFTMAPEPLRYSKS